MKKKCDKGKSCGSSCIERSDVCLIELEGSVSSSASKVSRALSGLSKESKVPENKISELIGALNLSPSEKLAVGRDYKALREMAAERKRDLWDEITRKRRVGGKKAQEQLENLQKEYDKLKNALKTSGQGSKPVVSVKTKGATLKANSFDRNFIPTQKVEGTKSDFNWRESTQGAKFGGKGAYGSVLFKDNLAIKRGEIGENELSALKVLGSVNLGPQLVYGETGNKIRPGTFEGRIAMQKVDGRRLSEFGSPKDKIGDSTVSDVALKLRANVHRQGIAHNDMHGGNVLVNTVNGKPEAKVVDLGMASVRWKAALSEAAGLVVSRDKLPENGTLVSRVSVDYQARHSKSNFGYTTDPGKMSRTLSTINSNFLKVRDYMLNDMGLSKSQVSIILSSGIRKPESFFNQGAWNKISDSDAKRLIEMLYEGV